jgi:hypothetical protein
MIDERTASSDVLMTSRRDKMDKNQVGRNGAMSGQAIGGLCEIAERRFRKSAR